ncbi:hypothetical protein QR680_011513 [Steinernema hermaphroditum]|uniref:Uncharacterized protein n=1 Tax=Steinernema hermaphroditum TaxID=289476 RepID=A0AA39I110_9BILA|nr:hypothetical protein QR680_011513 [Steinernema hermaphroditum]
MIAGKSFCLLLIAFAVLTTTVPTGVSARNLLTAQIRSVDDCPVHNNDVLHSVMGRVCEMCHEMFGGNTREECRAQCFNTHKFKNCLSLFRPQGL